MSLGRNKARQAKKQDNVERAGYRLPNGNWVTLQEDQRNVPEPAPDEDKASPSPRDAVSALLLIIAMVVIFIGVLGILGIWWALIVLGGMLCMTSLLLAL